MPPDDRRHHARRDGHEAHGEGEHHGEMDRRHGARQGEPGAPALRTGELANLPEARWLAARPGVTAGLRSNSLPALLAAAKRGQGIVPLSSAWGDREPDLQRLFDVPGLPPRALWLVSTPAGAKRAAVRAVADALVAAFADVPRT